MDSLIEYFKKKTAVNEKRDSINALVNLNIKK